MKKILFILIACITVGCATQGASNKIVSLESGSFDSSNGVLLLSLGRDTTQKGWPIPFVSYVLYSQNEASQAEKVSFFPAKAGLLNKLGKGKYGFIHYRELKPGKYYMTGQRGRGNGLDNPSRCSTYHSKWWSSL